MEDAAKNPFGSTAIAERQITGRPSLVQKFASKYTIEADKLLPILKATAFKQRQGEVSNEQMAALLVVADQYGLNPFTREIFAFPDKQNGIVPVVGVDGWSRIINDHPQSDGFEFRQSEEWAEPVDGQKCPIWMEVVIYRKDRAHPIVVREYLDEVYRKPFSRDGGGKIMGPWQTHTKRFLRHKTLIQGARLAYGFGGIYDEDEAERIIERDITPAREEPEQLRLTGAEALKAAAKAKPKAKEQTQATVAAGGERGEGEDPSLGIPGAGDISHVGKPNAPAAGTTRKVVDENGEILFETDGIAVLGMPGEHKGRRYTVIELTDTTIKVEFDKSAPKDGGGPKVTYAKLKAVMESRKDTDMLDSDATLIGEIPDHDEQNKLAKLYQTLRKQLRAR